MEIEVKNCEKHMLNWLRGVKGISRFSHWISQFFMFSLVALKDCIIGQQGIELFCENLYFKESFYRDKKFLKFPRKRFNKIHCNIYRFKSTTYHLHPIRGHKQAFVLSYLFNFITLLTPKMNFFQLNSSHCSATQIQNFFSFPLPKKN
jgi:hypothetical protein